MEKIQTQFIEITKEYFGRDMQSSLNLCLQLFSYTADMPLEYKYINALKKWVIQLATTYEIFYNIVVHNSWNKNLIQISSMNNPHGFIHGPEIDNLALAIVNNITNATNTDKCKFFNLIFTGELKSNKLKPIDNLRKVFNQLIIDEFGVDNIPIYEYLFSLLVNVEKIDLTIVCLNMKDFNKINLYDPIYDQLRETTISNITKNKLTDQVYAKLVEFICNNLNADNYTQSDKLFKLLYNTNYFTYTTILSHIKYIMKHINDMSNNHGYYNLNGNDYQVDSNFPLIQIQEMFEKHPYTLNLLDYALIVYAHKSYQYFYISLHIALNTDEFMLKQRLFMISCHNCLAPQITSKIQTNLDKYFNNMPHLTATKIKDLINMLLYFIDTREEHVSINKGTTLN